MKNLLYLTLSLQIFSINLYAQNNISSVQNLQIKNLKYVDFDGQTYEMNYRNSDLYAVEDSGQHFILNERGKRIITVDTYNPRVMKNNTLLIKKDGKWGIIDKKGVFVIEVKFTSIEWLADILVLINDEEIMTFNPENAKINVCKKSSSIQ